MKQWKNITLEKYLDIIELQQYRETSIKNILLYLYDIDIDTIPINKLPEAIDKLKFLNEVPIVKLKNNYKINNHKYKLNIIPQNYNYNQFLDFQSFSNDNDIVGILSTVLIPKGHKYNDGYDMQQVKEDILQMNYLDVNTISNFFLTLLKNYAVTLQAYLQELIKKTEMTEEMKNELTEKITQLTTYLVSPLQS